MSNDWQITPHFRRGENQLSRSVRLKQIQMNNCYLIDIQSTKENLLPGDGQDPFHAQLLGYHHS